MGSWGEGGAGTELGHLSRPGWVTGERSSVAGENIRQAAAGLAGRPDYIHWAT